MGVCCNVCVLCVCGVVVWCGVPWRVSHYLHSYYVIVTKSIHTHNKSVAHAKTKKPLNPWFKTFWRESRRTVQFTSHSPSRDRCFFELAVRTAQSRGNSSRSSPCGGILAKHMNEKITAIRSFS